MYHFLPDLLYVQRGALSDDESSPEPTPPTTNTESNTQQDRASEDAAVGHKKLRSASSNSSQTRHTDTNKRRLTDSDHDRSSSTQSALNKDFSSSTVSCNYNTRFNNRKVKFIKFVGRYVSTLFC